MSYLILLSCILSAVCSWLLLWFLIPQLQRRLPDNPNARSSHSQPTPRGGGFSFVLISSASSFIALLTGTDTCPAVLLLLAVPLAFVGLLDDAFNLPASWRYGVQFLTAAFLVILSPLVPQFTIFYSPSTWFYLSFFVFFVFVVTAVINFTNFMDGLDGLVAGCMTIAIFATSLALNAPWPIWILVGSLLGFLLWNWSPAKVFMGDVGSTFLGAVFAGLVLQASSWSDAIGFLLLGTPLLADACLCVLRRLFTGQSVFQAHRLHLFQRLHQAGWSHARVSFIYVMATALLAVVMLAGGWSWTFIVATAEVLFGLWLDQHVAVPFAVASKS